MCLSSGICHCIIIVGYMEKTYQDTSMIEWLNKSCMTTRGLLRDVNCCNNEHTINYNSELLLYNIQCILYYVYLVFCALGTDMFKH